MRPPRGSDFLGVCQCTMPMDFVQIIDCTPGQGDEPSCGCAEIGLPGLCPVSPVYSSALIWLAFFRVEPLACSAATVRQYRRTQEGRGSSSPLRSPSSVISSVRFINGMHKSLTCQYHSPCTGANPGTKRCGSASCARVKSCEDAERIDHVGSIRTGGNSKETPKLIVVGAGAFYLLIGIFPFYFSSPLEVTVLMI